MEDRGVILARGQRARRLDARLHRSATCARSSASGMSYPEFDRVFVVAGNPTRVAGHRRSCAPSIGSERSKTHAAARARAAAAVRRPAGRHRVPDHAAEPGAGLSRALGQLRDPHQRQLRQPGAAWRSSSSPRWPKNPGFVQPDTDLRLNKPEIFMEVDRERAADAGVSVDQVARTVETMLGGRQVTRYKRDAEQYDVMVQTTRHRPHHARRHRQALRARPQRRDGAAVVAGARSASR